MKIESRDPLSVHVRVFKPNTDISKVEMEHRRCAGCGLSFLVSKKSKHVHHSRFCADLPTAVSWMGAESHKKVAEHFGKEFKPKTAK